MAARIIPMVTTLTQLIAMVWMTRQSSARMNRVSMVLVLCNLIAEALQGNWPPKVRRTCWLGRQIVAIVSGSLPDEIAVDPGAAENLLLQHWFSAGSLVGCGRVRGKTE